MGIPAQIEFNRDVRPLLADNCFACHGPDAANRKGKLRLEADRRLEIGGQLGFHAFYATRDPGARDAATNMMQFFEHESCGQCTPCRVGTAKAVRLMQSTVWDNETLEDINQVMADASICGLGQAAPNPVRSVQKYFPQEIA